MIAMTTSSSIRVKANFAGARTVPRPQRVGEKIGFGLSNISRSGGTLRARAACAPYPRRDLVLWRGRTHHFTGSSRMILFGPFNAT